MRTDPAEADLHLVGDADTAGGADLVEGRLEIALRQDKLSHRSRGSLRQRKPQYGG
jgi:hypothetical protein